MAITTPSMGLKRWDQPNDVFSYVELSDNFAALDIHDHTTGKGVQIPTGGIANLAVDNTKLANNAVTNTKVLDATLADAKLASPNNGSYRNLFSVSHRMTSADISGTTYIAANSTGFQSGNTTSSMIPMFPFMPTHYSVTGKTLQLRLTVGGIINATGPANTISFGLRPITSLGGGSGAITYSAGAVVGGTTLNFASPAASTTPIDTMTFAAPAQGVYGIGVTINTGSAANSSSTWWCLVQYAHV